MLGLIKSQFSYLISKMTIIVFFLVLFIDFTSFLLVSKNSNFSSVIQSNLYYFQNCFFLVKILSVMISLFLYSYSFLSKTDNYSYLVISSNVSRIKYFTSKLITITVVVFILVFLEGLIYLIVGAFFIDNFLINTDLIISFVNLFLIIFYYSLVAICFILVTDNIYILLIPFSLYIISSILIDNQEITKEVLIFLPNFKIEGFYLENSYFNIAFLIIFFCLVNLVIYDKKDL